MNRLEQLEERVHSYLAEMNLDAQPTSDDDLLLYRYGSTVVIISMFDDDQVDNTFVRIVSVMLKDAEANDQLLRRLLELNTEVLFGAFLLFHDNTLSFSATLLGNHLDFDEFETALSYVARVSDQYDEELQALGGGQRAEDVLRETE